MSLVRDTGHRGSIPGRSWLFWDGWQAYWKHRSKIKNLNLIGAIRCCQVMYKLPYPSIRVRTAPPVSVRVRVSVSFSYGVTILLILFLNLGLPFPGWPWQERFGREDGCFGQIQTCYVIVRYKNVFLIFLLLYSHILCCRLYMSSLILF